jgi:hypothetical protein
VLKQGVLGDLFPSSSRFQIDGFEKNSYEVNNNQERDLSPSEFRDLIKQ